MQVWEGKYVSELKSNWWGGNGGRKWPKNWREREVAPAELHRILEKQVLAQLAAKKAEEAGQFQPPIAEQNFLRLGSAENVAEGHLLLLLLLLLEEEEEEEDDAFYLFFQKQKR
jgi:hypothetical protein